MTEATATSPEAFIVHWLPGDGSYGKSESASAQPHFIGQCALHAVQRPDDTENYRIALKGFGDLAKADPLRRAFTDPASL